MLDSIKNKWNQLVHSWGRLNKKGKIIAVVVVVGAVYLISQI